VRNSCFLRKNTIIIIALYIYIRKDSKGIYDLDSLTGKKVAIVEGFIQEEYLVKNYPLIQRIMVKNSSLGLKLLVKGEVDALLGSKDVVEYLLLDMKLDNIKLVSDLFLKKDFQDSLHIAVRNDYPQLHSILQKAMDEVTPEQLYRLRDKWLIRDQEYKEKIFTPKQREWIKNHPVINVGGEIDWAPFDFVDQSGEYSGLAKDYMDAISRITGLKFKVKTDSSWDKLLNSLKNGQIDMLPAINYSKERETFINFTYPYLALTEYYITKENYPKINDIKELYGKKVTAIKGYQSLEWLKQKHPKIEIVEASGILDALQILVSGEADVFINDNPSTTYIMEKNFITGLQFNNIVKNRIPVPLHMGVKKGYEPLTGIINKAVKNISRDKKRNISDKWMSQIKNTKSNLELTEEEIVWLSKKPVISFSVDPSWLPLESIEEKSGRYEGMMADYLQKIKDITGINFKLVPTDSWSDSVNLARTNKIDMLAAASVTPERKKFLNFSDPTLTLTDGVIMKNDKSFITSLNDLNGLKVGVSEGTSLHNMLKKKYPKIILVPIKGTLKGIRELSLDTIDAFVGNLEVVSYTIFKNNLFDLKVVYKLEKVRKLRMAFRKDLPPEALSVVNKAINTISLKDIEIIRQRWIGLKVGDDFDYSLIWKAALVILLIFAVIVYNNRKLKQMVEKKTADLQEQKDKLFQFNKNLELIVNERTKDLELSKRSTDQILANILLPILITSKERRVIMYANSFSCDLYERSKEQLEGSYVDDIYTLEQGHQLIVDKIKQNGKVEAMEVVVITQKGKRFIGLLSVTPIHYKGEDCYLGMTVDITKQKDMENEVRDIHKKTKDSIEYASLIQGALIPEKENFKDFFEDYFTIWQPKDIVGGDIYLFEKINEDEALLMVIDCTGHGVPGAFVTMLVKAIERQIVAKIVNDRNFEVSPAWVLEYFNKNMKRLLKQEDQSSISNAGFDGGVLYFNKKENIIKYAGAETPLFYLEGDNELMMIKGDRHSIGYKKSDVNYRFKERLIPIDKGIRLYISTDGFIDQNGGQKGFPYGKKRFKGLIEENYEKTFITQKEIFQSEISKYQGKGDRNDDITMIGVRI
jgi:PAS domain S-box-containing protein